MKSTTTKTVLIIFLLSPMFSHAQEYLNKGNYMVGGRFTISDSGADSEYVNNVLQETRRSIYSISPYLGKFIKDKTLAGVRLHFSIDKYKNSSDSEFNMQNQDRHSNTYGLTFFLKKHYTINDKFGGFLEPGLSYEYENLTNDYTRTDKINNAVFEDNSTTKDHNISLGARLGLYYFLSPRFSIETTFANISLRHSIAENIEADENSVRRKDSSYSLYMNFINTISLNEIFTVNYYF